MSLNEHQHAAAHAPHDQPVKIIAGAGTGKTETLAARYVALVQSGIAPDKIVLLTFTEDAAAEMRARVTLRLREAAIDLAPHALLDLPIATFHGFAMRLLHEYGFGIGLPPTPRLLSDDDQREVWQSIREAVEAGDDLPAGYDPLDHTTYRWDSDETWNRALAIADALRRGGGQPHELAPHERFAAQQTTEFAAHRAQLVPLIEHCWARYTAHLRGRGALDYDELLQAALRLLAAKPAIGARFDVLMIDEFQDTNRPQLALLERVQHSFARTTVVGDPRQAIYGWNSARAESIYQFPFRGDGSERKQHDLIANYRSHPAIIAVANMALHGTEFAAQAPLRPADQPRSDPPMALIDQPAVSLHVMRSVADEARMIAAEIGRLRERGVAYGAIAVLLRSRTQLQPLLAALGDQQIPYVVNGGTGLYLDPLVRLTSSLLRVVADPADAAAWVHVLESPLIGLPPHVIALRGAATDGSDRSALLARTWLGDPDSVPPELPQRAAMIERLHAFRAVFAAARERWGVIAPAAYLLWLWRSCGLHSEEQYTRLVLRQIVRDADEYAATHPADGIAGFAALLERRVREQPRVALPTVPTSAAVEVATVHQAKGREWPVVFVYHTTLPSQRATQVDSVLWDEQWQLVISGGSTTRRKGADPLHDLRDDLRRRKRNEERSIWYVALTRAQHRLYVLHSGCVPDGGRFVDAGTKFDRAARGDAAAKDDESVHFFHELWELIHTAAPDGIVCEIQPEDSA